MEYHTFKTTPLPKKLAAPPEDPSNLKLPPLGILSGLSPKSLVDLAGYGRCHRFPTGTEVMREGERQERFYVIASGEVAASAQIGGKEIPLNICGPGECIGEVNLLEPGPATASVKITKDAVLWSMDIVELRTYIFEHTGGAGALLLGMAQNLSQRIRQANKLIAKNHVRPVETLPAGRDRAITAGNTPVQVGFFDRFKKKITGTKKVQISTKIKM